MSLNKTFLSLSLFFVGQFVEGQLHDELFKGCMRRFKQPKANLLSKRRHNSAKQKSAMGAFMKKQKKRIAKLAAMNIDYKFEDITFDVNTDEHLLL